MQELVPIYYSPDAGGGGGKGGAERGDELLRGEGREYFYVDSNFVSLLNDLRVVSREGPPKDAGDRRERELAEASLERDWERLMSSQLIELQAVLDNQLLRFKSPYPYDSRRQEMWFENLSEAVERAQQENWPEPGTPQRRRVDAWLNRVTIDSRWGEANFRLLEGLGVVLPNFYDGKKMMQWVSMPVRTDPIASYYELTFAKTIPGVGMTAEQRALLPEGAQEGLRERAVRYQDENTYWRLALASVHQVDLERGEKPFMEKLTPAEVEFIRRVFIDYEPDVEADQEVKLREKIYEKLSKNPSLAQRLEADIANLKRRGGWLVFRSQSGVETPVPSALLNWHAMEFVEEKKRRYMAVMSALLTEKAKNELQAMQTEDSQGRPSFDAQKMDDLVQRINTRAESLLKNWHSAGKSWDEKLAGVVVRAGIIVDWGHMSALDMSWGWNYYLDLEEPKGGDPRGEWRIVVKRRKDMGGTTVSTDIGTPGLWRETEAGDQRKAWSKGYLPPMTPDYIKEVGDHSPDWRSGKLEEVLRQDQKFREAWEKIWEGEEGFVWDEKARKFLEEMVWFWPTPMKEKDQELMFPVFFPPSLASLNFWNSVSFEGGRSAKTRAVIEGGKVVFKQGNPTVWDKLRTGGNMSDIDWKKMGDQQLYRWMITIGQTVRYIVTMLDPEFAAEDQSKAFFASPDQLREIIKRADLGERDNRTPASVLVMSLAPLLVVLKTAADRGILGEAGINQKNREKWAKDIAKWMAAFKQLPDTKDGIKGYGRSMARLARFYATIIARMGVAEGKVEEYLARDIYNEELRPEFAKVGASIPTAEVTTKPEEGRPR